MPSLSLRARAGTVLGLALVLVACAKSTSGHKAPVFSLESTTGAAVTVDPTVDQRGKILIFWASW